MVVYLFLVLDVFAMMASNKQCENENFHWDGSMGGIESIPLLQGFLCVWGGGVLLTLILFLAMLDAH
jgi:hypothetical protein